MRILLGKHSGFCFGVRRAVTLAEEASAQQTPVYTYGNIIHNESVVEELKARGVIPVQSADALQAGDTLIIRAHGAPPEVYRAYAERGITVIDATCPFVRRIHKLVSAAAEEGQTVLIAGRGGHPEVAGIRGHAGDGAVVLESPADAAALPAIGRACIVAQTTLPAAQFQTILDAVRPHVAKLTVYDTICDTTRLRQNEAAKIAGMCSKVCVIGSKSSANTERLRQICLALCKNTETVEHIGKKFLDKLQSDDIIGIVAGASTPDRMIREVIQVMSEQENTTIETIEAEAPAEVIVAAEPAVNEEVVAAETPVAPVQEQEAEQAAGADETEFAEAFEKTMTRIHNGQLITGTVLQIVDGEVFVNVGYKSDGIIPKNEFSTDADANPAEMFKEGDEIEVEVLKVNDGEGNVLLSRKNVESKKLWDDLLGGDGIEGKIFDAVGKEVVKGGVIADINGIRAFVPASQVSIRYTENLNEFVGKPMKLKVLEVDKDRKRIVASQKQVLLAEQAEAKKEKWGQLVVGSKVPGIVRRITDFGAFVDIGGIDGLVHVTDIAWGRVKHPSDVLSIGQEIEVLILNVDAEKERISLGYKQLQPKPWTFAAEKYPVGSIVEGKVVRIVPFGAFVALESTIDGLIHISQVSVHRIAKVEDELKVGDVVRCKVLDVNTEAKRISLSRKEALIEEDPEIAAQVEAERAERDRQYQERQEQRTKEREQRSSGSPAASAPRQPRERSAAPSSDGDRRDRGGDRRRRSEDGDYELPPVQSTTTSLADLFQNFKTED